MVTEAVLGSPLELQDVDKGGIRHEFTAAADCEPRRGRWWWEARWRGDSKAPLRASQRVLLLAPNHDLTATRAPLSLPLSAAGVAF